MPGSVNYTNLLSRLHKEQENFRAQALLIMSITMIYIPNLLQRHWNAGINLQSACVVGFFGALNHNTVLRSMALSLYPKP